ncbi:MAG: NADP(H)-dependent aldo-keto reductase [Proteobacteria bacterium]|nr:NADP(H)-dependent aldo-keto reductase [Pseudomonadota bacterium]
MRYNKLGNTDVDVSVLCLGTMTWGDQNTEVEAHEQLNYSFEQGINFIDTAEMYPVFPPNAETQGLSERYIGTWMQNSHYRQKIVLATKVTGPARDFTHIRKGPKLIKQQIKEAIEKSLERLKTDYIDLYQVHWPARSTNFFGQLGFQVDETEEPTTILETLTALGDLVQEGKVRYVGISNETPWGMNEYMNLAKKHNLPEIVSIQNPYNLLNRAFEVGLAEISYREEIGLLAYSPLAFGTLTGKYRHGARPPGGRLTLFERFQRYNNKNGVDATESYLQIAEKYDLNPTQMALAYINQRPFLTSTIIGATTMTQLKENIGSSNLTLNSEVVQAIEEVHKINSNPCP